MEDKNEQKQKGELTPIVDGDARPDINLDPQENEKRDHPIPIPGDADKNKKKDKDKNKDKFTTNRVDTNSLEDYKDAK